MEPSVSRVTLDVSDLERSVAIYHAGLEWPGSEVSGAVASCKSGGGVIALFPKPPIVADAGVNADDGGFSRRPPEVYTMETLANRPIAGRQACEGQSICVEGGSSWQG